MKSEKERIGYLEVRYKLRHRLVFVIIHKIHDINWCFYIEIAGRHRVFWICSGGETGEFFISCKYKLSIIFFDLSKSAESVYGWKMCACICIYFTIHIHPYKCFMYISKTKIIWSIEYLMFRLIPCHVFHFVYFSFNGNKYPT